MGKWCELIEISIFVFWAPLIQRDCAFHFLAKLTKGDKESLSVMNFASNGDIKSSNETTPHRSELEASMSKKVIVPDPALVGEDFSKYFSSNNRL